MIEVQDLTKSYGCGMAAVDHVSFTVNKGEILGFLGPERRRKNHHHADSDRLHARHLRHRPHRWFDVFNDSLEVRTPHRLSARSSPGLSRYDRGDLSGLRGAHQERPGGKAQRARVRTPCNKTNIADKRDELIKRLSRGYKQRVGFAQALVHDPDVIILDEPTVGLDPKQIIEVRNLIKGLAGNHTIILSTHILPEVSMTCDRVVIINKGKIAASIRRRTSPASSKAARRSASRCRRPKSRLQDLLTQIPGRQSRGGGNGPLERPRRRRPSKRPQGTIFAAKLPPASCKKAGRCMNLRGVSLSLEDIFLAIDHGRRRTRAGR